MAATGKAEHEGRQLVRLPANGHQIGRAFMLGEVAAPSAELASLVEAASSPREEGFQSPIEREHEVRHRSAGSEGAAYRSCPAGSQSNAVDDGANAESLRNFWHRAGWLVLLLMCQSTSSIILQHFDLLLRHHPVVLYFLTMLVGAGGNAGGQSTVLVVRQLALASARGGKWHAHDDRLSVRRIVGAEVYVGARLAVVLFFASLVRCFVFKVRGVECLAICLSMLVIVFTSTVIGSALPLLLKRLEMDPAHAGATIQVVMDVSGVTLTCIVSCLVLGLPIGQNRLHVLHNATAAP